MSAQEELLPPSPPESPRNLVSQTSSERRTALKTPLGAFNHIDDNDGVYSLDDFDPSDHLLFLGGSPAFQSDLDDFENVDDETPTIAVSSLRHSVSQLRMTQEVPVLSQIFAELARASGEGPSTSHRKTLRSSTLPEVSRVLEGLVADAIQTGQDERVGVLLSFQEQLNTLPSQFSADQSAPVSENEILILAPPKPSLRNSLRSSVGFVSPSAIAASSSGLSEASIECPICFDLHPPEVMKSFSTCGEHLYCVHCLSAHLLSLITNGEVTKITCPFPGCPFVPLEDDIQDLVAPDVFDKYLRFMVLAVLKDVPTIWCPNRECGAPCLNTEATCDNRGECPNCSLLFCILCMQPYHAGVLCDGKTPDEMHGLMDWVKEKGHAVKPCYSCKQMVEKNYGCMLNSLFLF